MVVFQDGVATPTEHRIFNIKSVKGANDVASLKEVLIRRFAHVPGGSKDAWPMPELVLIDGGLPQLHAAQIALNIRRVHVPLMSLAKGIDRKGVTFFHRADPELERIGKEYKDLLVNLRDESHRFAIKQYRKRHRKSLILGEKPTV
jgi:excinuclease ABC subunit C